MERFREQVGEGQLSSLTKENPALIAAEETLVEMKYAVEKAKGMILEAERDSKIVRKCLRWKITCFSHPKIDD